MSETKQVFFESKVRPIAWHQVISSSIGNCTVIIIAAHTLPPKNDTEVINSCLDAMGKIAGTVTAEHIAYPPQKAGKLWEFIRANFKIRL